MSLGGVALIGVFLLAWAVLRLVGKCDALARDLRALEKRFTSRVIREAVDSPADELAHRRRRKNRAQ